MGRQLPQNTSSTTELAKQRNHHAAERTLLAWVQTGLMLLGIGITFDTLIVAPQQSRDASVPSNTLSLVIIPLGLCLLGLAAWQYWLSVRSVRRTVTRSSQLVAPVAAAGVILFGIVAATIVLFRNL